MQNGARDAIRSHLASMDGEQSFRQIYLFDSSVEQKHPSAYNVGNGKRDEKQDE